MRIKASKKKINQLTYGLFDCLIDLALFSVFFSAQSYSIGRGKTGIIKAINNAIKSTKLIHINSLQRVIYKAKSRNYLEKKEDYLKISQLGKERLARTIPKYDKKRPWDGIIYLITYDISEERKNERDDLRNYLKKMDCAMLQQSVWLTPYNPKNLIIDFIKKRGLFGQVLISELKEGSGIGGKDILETVSRIYHLDYLNDQYRNFVRTVEKGGLKSIKLIMAYLAILKIDPQLPFELLPEGFWGEDAYEVYLNELKRIIKQREKLS